MEETVKLPPEGAIFETLSDSAGFYLVGGQLIESGHSEYQSYEVWNSPQYGKLFRLDGYCMTSERDEFFYHENLIHVPCVTHAAPRRALIIGGGDGGSAEELFKYPGMERVVLVELDGKVLEIAREHLEVVHRGALNDPRLELRIEDGLRYVREVAPARNEKFDLVVLDLTDPIGPAEALYTPAFFEDCKALLNDRGAMVLHTGAPIFQPARVRQLVDNLRSVFCKVSPYFMYIPLYGSLWGMAVASDTLDPMAMQVNEVDARIEQLGLRDLQHYNGGVHCAQFVLPNYLRKLLHDAQD